MRIFVVFLAVFFVVLFCYLQFKYSNPYKLIMVFGKKGSGKTTYLVKVARRYLKRKKLVYSNVRLKDVVYVDPLVDDLSSLPDGSVILLDEVGMIWDNRNFKSFRTSDRDYFKMQRHHRHVVYLFSQTFDVDVKIRVLTDQMYLVKSCTNFLSSVRRISRTLDIVEATADSESRIVDNLHFVPLISFIWGGKPLTFTFIPKYAKYFDSFSSDVSGSQRKDREEPRRLIGFRAAVFAVRNSISACRRRLISVLKRHS